MKGIKIIAFSVLLMSGCSDNAEQLYETNDSELQEQLQDQTTELPDIDPDGAICVVPMTEESESEPEYVDRTPRRNRMPSQYIMCTISKSSGITVSGYSNSFLSYEIWDEEGEVCIGSFAYESDFINELFSMQGDFQLRFIAEDTMLVGYINI